MKNFSYAVIIFFIILLNVSFSYANISQIILNQRRSVVTIYVNDENGNLIGSGTGFIIDSNGKIATNYHVMSMWLEGNNSLLVRMENGAFFPLSELVNFDEDNDVAIFKVDGKELPSVKLAKKYEPKLGESIVVIGSPLGFSTTISDGIVSNIRGKDKIIQITAPVSPGSSGSPVFNSKGEVIGVATFNIEGGQNLNFAIPVKHVANLLKGTKKSKKKIIVKSEPQPKVMTAPSFQGLTAVDWVNKALSLWDGEKYNASEKAIEYLNNAIKLEPSYAEAYYNRGNAYNKPGQYNRAIEDFNEAIRLNPYYALAYVNRGNAYLKLEQYDRAIKDFNEAIRLNSGYAEAYYNRGLAYFNLKQYARTIEDCNEAIRLNPYFALAYNNRAIAYFNQGNEKQCCLDAKKACELGVCKVLERAKGNGYCR
jgi:hypothetical protein